MGILGRELAVWVCLKGNPIKSEQDRTQATSVQLYTISLMCPHRSRFPGHWGLFLSLVLIPEPGINPPALISPSFTPVDTGCNLIHVGALWPKMLSGQ